MDTQNANNLPSQGGSNETTDTNATNPITVPSDPEKPKSQKKLLLVVLAIALIVGGITAFYFSRKSTDNSAEGNNSNSSSSKQEKGSVFCAKVGLDSIQCENLNTKVTKKYTLPESLGDITIMAPNPSGNRFYIASWVEDSSKETSELMAVYDNKLDLVTKLPYKTKKDGDLDISSIEVKWLDDKTLIYEKYDSNSTKPKTTVYSLNIETQKESKLLELDIDLENIIPLYSKNYLYGLEAYEVKAEGATKRRLIAIDLDTKEVKKVDGGGVEEEFSFNSETALIYINTLKSDEQKFDINVYEVANLDSNPQLKKVQQIKNKYAGTAIAYSTFVTAKGLYLTDAMLENEAPYTFYDKNGKATKSSLAVGTIYSDLFLSLSSFPNFPKAKSNEITTRDFFRPASGTPKKIVSFLDNRVRGEPGCDEGEYMTFEIDKYDGDKQFSVGEAGCSSVGGLVFYKAANNSYKKLAAIQEGMSCAERDKLGISAKIYPDCITNDEEGL